MTAVEWLEEKLDNHLEDTDYLTWKLVCEDLKQAKEMEKQQIKDAYLRGIENYDPTFKTICEHRYITSADWKSQTCTKCQHRINL